MGGALGRAAPQQSLLVILSKESAAADDESKDPYTYDCHREPATAGRTCWRLALGT